MQSCTMAPAQILLERDHELAEIRALLERARAGDGGVLVIEGPLGIGKSALLDAAAGLAARVARAARPRRAGRARSQLRARARALRGVPARRRCRDARALARRGRRLPPNACSATRSGAAADPAAAAYGLYWLLASIAGEQPVVLLIDDLHECDPASLRWLAYLARRIEGLPVAVLAATRPRGCARAVGVEGVRVLRPALLGEGATAELISRRTGALPDPGFVEDCHAATGWQPAAARRAARIALGERLRKHRARAHRAARAGGRSARSCRLGARRRLRAAAREPARRARTRRGHHGARVARRTWRARRRAAARLRALAPARGGLPLDAGTGARGRARSCGSDVVRRRSAPIEVIAHHLLRSEPIGAPWAPVALEASARIAITRGDPDAAVAYLRRALEERPDALTRGETCARWATRSRASAIPLPWTCSGRRSSSRARPSIRAEIVDESIDLLLARGRTDDCRRLLGRVLDERESLDSERTLRLLARLAAVRAWDDSGDDRALDELRALEPTLDRLYLRRAVRGRGPRAVARDARGDGCERRPGSPGSRWPTRRGAGSTRRRAVRCTSHASRSRSRVSPTRRSTVSTKRSRSRVPAAR